MVKILSNCEFLLSVLKRNAEKSVGVSFTSKVKEAAFFWGLDRGSQDQLLLKQVCALMSAA